MDDLISRQDTIDRINEYIEEYSEIDSDGNHSEKWCAMQEAKMTIENMPSAQPEPRWIPCSERLPETSGTYLVSGMWESGRVAVGDCEYTSYDGYFNTAWNFDVLAWMLLPEPYQESEQDENR